MLSYTECNLNTETDYDFQVNRLLWNYTGQQITKQKEKHKTLFFPDLACHWARE